MVEPFWELISGTVREPIEEPPLHYALVFIFFHDRFGLDGQNSRGASSPRWPAGAEGDAQNGLTPPRLLFLVLY